MQPIPNFHNYFITTEGNIWSNKTKQWLNQHVYAGYKSVVLYNKKQFRFRTHRLVALTYIPNIHNKPLINHIDGNKLNNCVSNLEWCTSSENRRHALATGLVIPKKGENHPLFGKPNLHHNISMPGYLNPNARKVKCLNTLQIFDTLTEAANWAVKCSSSKISNVCKGFRKHAGKHPLTFEKLSWSYL